jgi:hypothetical protein
MLQKHRISTNIGDNQNLIVELKQNIDLLEILSLKITQKEIYSSLCSDYGVVCGRITANNGFGIPNAKVSIFVPYTGDTNNKVINDLYPYTSTTNDFNKDGFRYNLLPNTKQHSGHVPTGTFPSQQEILNRSEVLEVYENYYNFTVKTNHAGDFMIWGCPIGQQEIHVDIDLSDIGCFSLRPYDFIKKGYGEENFDRIYNFKASNDLDGLPQVVSFNKTIDVYPFWGDVETCNIGISRTDFDLTKLGIKIEPISLVLLSSITDSNKDAVKRNGKIRKNSGNKCNLITSEGKIEAVRFTKDKVYGSDNLTMYPKLEYYPISETIDQNGVAMAVIPMNMDYVITNEFGEQIITNDSDRGIPTTTVLRMRVSLNNEDKKTTTADYLVPNIREFNNNSIGNINQNDEYNEGILSSYIFSDVFEDYISPPKPNGITYSSSGYSNSEKEKKKKLILGTDNNNIPEDYFYKFTYGKVYTVSSFQSSHFENTTSKNAFLGIKNIIPNDDDDCSNNTNYIPTNFAFKNKTKFSLIIAEISLFFNYIFSSINLFFNETVGRFILTFGFIAIKVFKDLGKNMLEAAFRFQESHQKILPLTIYPDCEECSLDSDNSANNTEDELNYFCRIGEVKFDIIPYNDSIYFFIKDTDIENNLRNSTISGTTFLSDLFKNQSAKSNETECSSSFSLTKNNILDLGRYDNATNTDKRFYGGVYTLSDNTAKDTFNNFTLTFNDNYININEKSFKKYDIKTPTTDENTFILVEITKDSNGNEQSVKFSIIDSNKNLKTVFEDVEIKFTTNNTDCNFINETVTHSLTILEGSSSSVFSLISTNNCSNGNTEKIKFLSIVKVSTDYPVYVENKYGNQTNLTGIAIKFTFDEWNSLTGVDYNTSEPYNIYGTSGVIRIYDSNYILDGFNITGLTIEQGCEKYDKFYNEKDNQFTFLWGTESYGDPNYPANTTNNKLLNDRARRFNSSYDDIPTYANTPYTESLSQPTTNHTLLSTISGTYATKRLPKLLNIDGKIIKFNKKTKSGLTEIRDGVITIVPVIDGKSNNQKVLQEWYRRKRLNLNFCGGVVNYSFIDNWLHGLLYFFKFDFKIRWDNFENYDLNVRGTKYPRELVFFNILDNKFYYRSTPYNLTNGFIGRDYQFYKEILRPTTFYDVGVRDEYLNEICYDSNIDPSSAVIRDITTTSFQNPANIVEYAIDFKSDIANSKLDLNNFFKTTTTFNNIERLDGDLIQLFSINNEAGIEAFDTDSPHYFIYNNEYLDPEDDRFKSYFMSNNNYGPTLIDFKLDNNGLFIRESLNFRLGDFSQEVPFFLWDKKGEGFGPYNSFSDTQDWDKTEIISMKLQRIKSINSKNSTTTNYIQNDGIEEYLLKPITINHNSIFFTGNTTDTYERFDVISINKPDLTTNGALEYIEGDIWLTVTSGTTKDPLIGDIYVVVNKTWVKQNESYIKDVRETFLTQTALNYSGTKQVLSTPFLFYFGLRPKKTAIDTFIKYYGPKL